MLFEALQMLKFNFKKLRLNFMSEWQTVVVADEEEEDWLRVLTSADNNDHRMAVQREISDSCDLADIPYIEMPEEAAD
jgi:hypothetical protein